MFTIAGPVAGVTIAVPLLFVLGWVAGVLSSFFGVGGGWVVTPVLHFLGFPMIDAVGTGLAYIGGTSLMSVLRHRKHGNVAWRAGAWIGGTMLLGVWLGTVIVKTLNAQHTADRALSLVYVVFLLAVAVMMAREFRKADAPPGAAPDAGERRTGDSIVRYLAIGACAGLLSGLLGVGGGVVVVPALVLLLGFSAVRAVGTSLFCILLASPFGMAVYGLDHHVSFLCAAVMILGAACGVPFGVWSTRRVKGRFLKLLYGITMVLGAAAVVLKLAAQPTAALVLICCAAGGMTALVLTLALLAPAPAPAAKP